jgi:hypothetical protein
LGRERQRRVDEWFASDGFTEDRAHYDAERGIDAERRQHQWDAEAADAGTYAASLEAVPTDPVATALVRDMVAFEAEGRVVWVGDGWRKPRRYPPAPHQPLTADQLLSRFDKVRKIRAGWQATCPAHVDRHPSLSIRRGDKWWLTWCHAGCSTRAICAAVGLAVSDLALGGDNG